MLLHELLQVTTPGCNNRSGSHWCILSFIIVKGVPS